MVITRAMCVPITICIKKRKFIFAVPFSDSQFPRSTTEPATSTSNLSRRSLNLDAYKRLKGLIWWFESFSYHTVLLSLLFPTHFLSVRVQQWCRSGLYNFVCKKNKNSFFHFCQFINCVETCLTSDNKNNKIEFL